MHAGLKGVMPLATPPACNMRAKSTSKVARYQKHRQPSTASVTLMTEEKGIGVAKRVKVDLLAAYRCRELLAIFQQGV